MKIGFVTDTNFLKKKDEKLIKHTNYLDYIDKFLNYIKDSEKYDNNSKLVYFMPEIILEELYCQRITIFSKEYAKFKEQYEELAHSILGDCPQNDIKKTALEEKEKYKKSQFCRILKLETSKELLDELIQDALEKKAPFDKSIVGEKTDAGFKDALIWKTVLYNKEIDECDKFYFFSCDKVFDEFKEPLIKEFQSFHPNVQCVIQYYEPQGNQISLALELMIKDNDLIETNIVKLSNPELMLEYIKKINYNKEAGKDVIMKGVTSNGKRIVLSDILFNEFSTDDFVIDKVEKESDNYVVNLHFETYKYTITPELLEFNIGMRRYVFGNVELIVPLKKDYCQFGLMSESILDVQFTETPMEKMLKAMSEQLNAYEKYIKPIKDSISPDGNLRRQLNNLLSAQEQLKNSFLTQEQLRSIFHLETTDNEDYGDIEQEEENLSDKKENE